MDQIRELGALGLVSRMRRLLEELMRDGKRVYGSLGIDFEVRWFAVFELLSRRSPMSITELARTLRLRHPTVIQVVDELTERGLLVSTRDNRDKRRRGITLSLAGRDLVARLRPVWQAFGDAGCEVTAEGENDFMASLQKLEQAMQRRSMFERITLRIDQSREAKDGHVQNVEA